MKAVTTMPGTARNGLRALACCAFLSFLVAQGGCGKREDEEARRPFGPKSPAPIARRRVPSPPTAEKPSSAEPSLPPAAAASSEQRRVPETPGADREASSAPSQGVPKAHAGEAADAEAAAPPPPTPSPYAHLTRWSLATPHPFKVVPAKTGSISGVIGNPQKCTGVAALARGTGDPRKIKVIRGRYDPATGRFSIAGLAPGTYDLRVYVPGGWIDGANLRLEDRQRTGKPLAEDDIKEILDKIANFPDRFVDIIRPLAVAGTDRHAKVLVEKIRYRQFHSGKPGERVWRVEIWNYTNHYGGWVKDQHGWLVLSRIRAPFGRTTAEYLRNLLWLFDPALGGIRVEKDRAIADFRYRVPDPLTAAMGKVPGGIERLVAEDVKKKQGKDLAP